MAEVERIDKRVKYYLINVGYERWSRAHSTVNRTLTMTSNIAESINAVLKAARELLVLPLLEYIRQLIGRWNITNQKNAIESFTDLGKKYDTMLMDNLELSHRIKVTPLTSYLYSVLDKGKQRMVFLKDRTCGCRRNYLLKTSEILIYPIPDESTRKIPAEVLDEKVLAPDVTKSIGRPRKGRCKPISERERKRSIMWTVWRTRSEQENL
nr:uncharacterized protein LOC104084943 [Nicotiana tomentosiformis]